jgi:hypothetical protein
MFGFIWWFVLSIGIKKFYNGYDNVNCERYDVTDASLNCWK